MIVWALKWIWVKSSSVKPFGQWEWECVVRFRFQTKGAAQTPFNFHKFQIRLKTKGLGLKKWQSFWIWITKIFDLLFSFEDFAHSLMKISPIVWRKKIFAIKKFENCNHLAKMSEMVISRQEFEILIFNIEC
jgi:hypothetical protein